MKCSRDDMVKKRKRPVPPHKTEQDALKRADNPFEQLHQHKKFDVLGKRSKGNQRKLIKSRTDAVDKVRIPAVRCASFHAIAIKT